MTNPNIYSNIYDTTERDQQGAQMKKWLEETNSNPLNLFKNMVHLKIINYIMMYLSR